MKDLEPIDILLAEDDIDHADIAIEALTENGVKNRVTHVNNGLELLKVLKRQAPFDDEEKYPYPHLILLDINMPQMNGLEALKEIKNDQEYRKIPVIMLTTSARQKEIGEAYELGANSFVTKPVSFSEFNEKIKCFNSYWVSVNELPKPIGFGKHELK